MTGAVRKRKGSDVSKVRAACAAGAATLALLGVGAATGGAAEAGAGYCAVQAAPVRAGSIDTLPPVDRTEVWHQEEARSGWSFGHVLPPASRGSGTSR